MEQLYFQLADQISEKKQKRKKKVLFSLSNSQCIVTWERSRRVCLVISSYRRRHAHVCVTLWHGPCNVASLTVGWNIPAVAPAATYRLLPWKIFSREKTQMSKSTWCIGLVCWTSKSWEKDKRRQNSQAKFRGFPTIKGIFIILSGQSFSHPSFFLFLESPWKKKKKKKRAFVWST